MASQLIFAGTRLTAALLNSISPLAARKTADQSLTSNVTFQNDTQLFLPLTAGASYLFSCYIDYEAAGPAGGDIKLHWSVPSAAELRYTAAYQLTSGFASAGITFHASDSLVAAGAGAGNLQGISMLGDLTVAGVAGNLQLLWAQNTTNATAAIVHARSSVALWQVP